MRSLRSRGLMLAIGIAFCCGASPCSAAPVTVLRHAHTHAGQSAERPVRKIGMFINGEELRSETSPEVIDGRLYLPMRSVFAALGLGIVQSDRTMTASLPVGNLVMRVDSAEVSVDGRSVFLDGPILRRRGTTYIPLRLLTSAVGAVLSYDQRAARVDIVSAYIGKNEGPELPAAGGGETVTGVVAAIDLNSAQPSVTVTAAGRARTIEVTSGANVYIEDASVHSQRVGTLSEIHVGDALRALIARDGRVLEMHDFFKSVGGLIAAVSPSAFVLESGKVVTPGHGTQISLNGAEASLDALKIGDYVTVRSNPESGELREIIASRSSAGAQQTEAPTATVNIASFDITATRPLRAGESFDAVLRGTPGGVASFDIGDALTNLVMHERSPGMYSGSFTIPARFNVARIPVYAHLRVRGIDAPRAQAAGLLSASTVAPQITEVAPPPGQTVNNERPTIYASFSTPADIGVDPSSISLAVNGHDVTASATRSATFITYSPGVDLPDGDIVVFARVADTAGNVETRRWTFSIRTK